MHVWSLKLKLSCVSKYYLQMDTLQMTVPVKPHSPDCHLTADHPTQTAGQFKADCSSQNAFLHWSPYSYLNSSVSPSHLWGRAMTRCAGTAPWRRTGDTPAPGQWFRHLSPPVEDRRKWMSFFHWSLWAPCLPVTGWSQATQPETFFLYPGLLGFFVLINFPPKINRYANRIQGQVYFRYMINIHQQTIKFVSNMCIIQTL